jgi:hypothetical protein
MLKRSLAHASVHLEGNENDESDGQPNKGEYQFSLVIEILLELGWICWN